MKLINVTTRYYIFLFLILLSLWSVAFYFIMKFEVYANIDEVLYNRASNIVKYIQQDPSAASNHPLSDFQIHEITKAEYVSYPTEVYSDTLVYEPTDDEYDEYRKLSASFHLDNRYLKIVVVKPRLESTEIFNTITFTLVPLSALMVIMLVISARVLNKKLWKPFYKVIDFLSGYRVDKQVKPQEHTSAIDEFNVLNESLQSLIARNAQAFQQQKQFIENASHETQTPLAVIQSQLEILLQMPDLTHEHAEIIQSALKETDRLTKLNKALLLLSKIENQQFMDSTEVHLDSLTRKLLTYFDEKRDKLNLTVKLESDSAAVVKTNAILAEVLLGNLLKNAFAHNISDGSVVILVRPSYIEIANTGTPIPEKDRIFDRFYNRSTNTDSWGLGLSIVKKIVEINGWRIAYGSAGNTHKFTVDF
jgi:signal transduction histidine kinase